ncbi:MAG: hypothetical protein K2P65_00490, partial [Lachnospiraceae bacterium]|nr:hypothetical protein [Lachnospiraceae bacterium]
MFHHSTIFKTFQTDLDGISNKLGFSKRSLAEWVSQISASFREAESALKGFGAAAKTAFVIPIDKKADWKKNEFGEIVSKRNIDSYIPKLSTDSARNTLIELQDIQRELNQTKGSWDDYNKHFWGGKKYLQNYAKENDVLKASVDDVKRANEQARDAAIAHNKALQAQTFSAKAGKAALQALATAGNMIAFALIGKGIELAAKKLDDWIHKTEKANDAMQDAVSGYESAKSSLENVTSELSQQEKALDALLAKGSLTYAEQEQLEELQAITRELRLQQDIEQKRTDAASREAADKTVRAYKAQYGKYDMSEAALNERLSDDSFFLPDDADDVIGTIVAYTRAKESLAQVQEDYDKALQDGTDTAWLAEDLQYSIDTVADYEQMLDANIADLQEKLVALGGEYDKAADKRDAGLESLSSDEKEIIKTYDVLYEAYRLAYEYRDPDAWKSMQIENVLDTVGIEKTREELINMAKEGALDEATIESYANLSAALEQNKISAGDLCAALTRLAALEDNTGSGIMHGEPAAPLSISQTIEQLSVKLKPAFDSLKSAWQNVFTDDGFDPESIDFTMLDSIRSSIESLNELEGAGIDIDMGAFDSFVSVLKDANATEEQAKQAFNDLATSIFYSTDATNGMTDETKELTAQLLSSLGITNAVEVAEYALMETKAQAILSAYNLINATEQEYASILAEGEAAGLTRQQIY